MDNHGKAMKKDAEIGKEALSGIQKAASTTIPQVFLYHIGRGFVFRRSFENQKQKENRLYFIFTEEKYIGYY